MNNGGFIRWKPLPLCLELNTISVSRTSLNEKNVVVCSVFLWKYYVQPIPLWEACKVSVLKSSNVNKLCAKCWSTALTAKCSKQQWKKILLSGSVLVPMSSIGQSCLSMLWLPSMWRAKEAKDSVSWKTLPSGLRLQTTLVNNDRHMEEEIRWLQWKPQNFGCCP